MYFFLTLSLEIDELLAIIFQNLENLDSLR